jgi:hypothetical protein
MGPLAIVFAGGESSTGAASSWMVKPGRLPDFPGLDLLCIRLIAMMKC